jgi:hypothetical protein
MQRALPLPRRRRHTRQWRIEAVEVPVLVAEIARNDAAVLLRLSGAVAVVTDDASAVLVLEAVAIAVFLSDGATAESERKGGSASGGTERGEKTRSGRT